MVAASPARPAPAPIASIAKVAAAMVLLEDHPLKGGEQGPTITVTEADVAFYQQARQNKESVVEVRLGEQLTEYQALQALLIPSGNNIADLLARWDAGSTAALVARMNARAAALRLISTHFADASGVSDSTVSTPAVLVALGMAAMRQPALAEIVGQAQADLPVTGTVFNVNYALGQSGIIGLKTGSSPAAGACYLFVADNSMGGRAVKVYGAVMGLPTLDDAFTAAGRLIAGAKPALMIERVVARDATIGRYAAPWGAGADIVAGEDLDLVTYPGVIVRMRLDVVHVHPPLEAGARVGRIHFKLGDQELEAGGLTVDPVEGPGARWRLTRTDV